jgi:hypothetical protein
LQNKTSASQQLWQIEAKKQPVLECYSQSEVGLSYSIIDNLAIGILKFFLAIAGFFLQSTIWFAKAINYLRLCLLISAENEWW